MPRRRRRASTAVLSGALVAALLGAVAGNAAATDVTAATAATAAAAGPAVPAPADDPFYATGPRTASFPLGAVVRSRRIDAKVSYYGVTVPTTSWQIAYRSQDAHRVPIVNVATVLVPTAAWTGSGPRPVVAYQNAEDSTGWQCAASYSLRTGSNLLTGQEQTIFSSALLRGYALLLPDHEGPTSAFLAGPQSAYLVLDAIRAALTFRPAGFSRSTPVGLWGYSGGAHATAWAAEQAAGYAPELHIAGAAIGGTPSNFGDSVRKLDGGPFTSFTLAGVAGVLNAYPEWDIRRYLSPAGVAAVARADDVCIASIGVSLAFQKISDLTTVPDILAVPSVAAMLARIDLGHAAPSMPTFVYYGGLDEAVPVSDAQALITRYCSLGGRVSSQFQPLAEHVSLFFTGTSPALDYLGARFMGQPPAAGCG